MWVEFIELFMEKVWPAKWEQYQQARYDYEGWINEDQVYELGGSELWCKCPGKRLRSVQVVKWYGKRMRVRDRS